MDKQKNILFVDDDQEFLNALRRTFQDEPFKTLYTTSGTEALEIMNQQKIDIVISDMKMPCMDGQNLLNIINERYPQTICILFSGQSTISQNEISALMHNLNQGYIFKFISKSINMNTEIKDAIREALQE